MLVYIIDGMGMVDLSGIPSDAGGYSWVLSIASRLGDARRKLMLVFGNGWSAVQGHSTGQVTEEG